MANINVVVDKTIADGYKLKFRTPCDSTMIEGLEVKYPAKNGVGTLIKKFIFKDAHGTELSGVGNLFVRGVMIEVLLDVTHSVAYIQNSDTNSYIESVKGEIQRLEEKQKQFLGVAGKAVEECERVAAETTSAIEDTKQATETLVLTHEDIVSGGYVEALKELNAGGKFSFWVGTQAEFDAVAVRQENCLYIITDDNAYVALEQQLAEANAKIAEANAKIEELTPKVVFFGHLAKDAKVLLDEDIRKYRYFHISMFTGDGVKDVVLYIMAHWTEAGQTVIRGSYIYKEEKRFVSIYVESETGEDGYVRSRIENTYCIFQDPNQTIADIPIMEIVGYR